MIAKLARTLCILTTFFLSLHSKTLATIRYVNFANGTPGAGTSWATAFNNLQSALAVSGFFDQIWVAQGTYTPSAPAGRSATFLLPGGTFIYGGFNGTETAVTQRNPSLYPTILSGDIGVVGNATDNCYHVVTIENSVSNPTLDGFTIRDGQADAGYPGSSVAAPDNTGGGVLVLAHAGEITAFTMYNCILTANFAVYGGALGAFGDGGQQTNHGGSRCLFEDNSAVYGGAMGNIASGGNWAALNYSSCMFINNTASGGNASVIYQTIDNGASNCQTNLQNCLFYNEVTPMFFSQTTGPSYWFDVMNCIIWTSGSPYTGGYANGNSAVSFDNCDVDGALPSGGSSLNADPLFVNAAGGDFHVSPCSPVVDAGFPWTFSGASTVDYGGQNRVQGSIDIGPYEQVKGTAATAPPLQPTTTYCLSAVASGLTATGSNLLWYTAASGGTGDVAAPTPSTASVGSVNYYVTQTPAASCESGRTAVTVTINAPATSPPSQPTTTYCQSAMASGLTATGSNLLWYTAASGGTGDVAAPTPSTASVGSVTYYVTQTPAASCESGRTAVTVTVNAPATAPPSQPTTTYCQTASASPLTAMGTNLLWYTAGSGGTGDVAAPTPSTASVGSVDYYVTQTPAASCESGRTAVTVTVKPAAGLPAASGPSYCQGATAAPLSVTGVNPLWYTAATGGVGSPAAPTPSTVSIGSVNYYVTQTPAGGCESGRSLVTVTVNSGATAPPIPTTTAYCQNAVASPLTATGANLRWYTAATGGTGDPAAPIPSTSGVGAINYYVTQTPAASCESLRTPVGVMVNPNPSAEFNWTAACVGKATKITATSSAADEYTWDFGVAGSVSGTGAGPYEVVWPNSNVYSVSLTAKEGQCQGQTQHLITVNPSPTVSINSSGGAACAGSEVSLDATGASTYQWSPAAGLSNTGVANPVAQPQNNITYTVTGFDDNGCSATATITLEMSSDCLGYYVPDAFTPNEDGKNDMFRVKTVDAPRAFSLQVFNRWGAKVFESWSIGTGWNGTVGGSPAPTGTYVYVIQATTSAGTLVRRQGTILLIR